MAHKPGKKFLFSFLRVKPVTLFLFALLLGALPAFSQDAKNSEIKEGEILPYLEQIIAWRHAIVDSESLAEGAREVLEKERLKLDSKSILQKSFTFARAQAEILESSEASAPVAAPKGNDTRRGRIAKATAEANKHAAELSAALAQRDITPEKRQELGGQLKLAKAQQELLATMTSVFSSEGDKSGALIDQINAVYRTAQSEMQDQPVAVKEDASGKTPAPKEKDTLQGNEGMLNLGTALFSLSRKKDALDKLSEQTRSLSADNHALTDSLRTSLRAALAEGATLGSEKDGDKADTYQDRLDELITHYKQLGAAIIPLGQISMLLENSQQNLEEWNRLVTLNWKSIFHQLILRLVILTVSIAIPLIISGLARRGTERYVSDVKRRSQLRTVRRIILAAVLAFVVLANFLTEFGSLATFAGFITAGLAVALQTVLISLVAHFLYFGRYGVRVGDIVTVSDVTGEVLQVGMMRLYLRQVKETDKGLSPTGKIVAFPNSILFQPTAFYKHLTK